MANQLPITGNSQSQTVTGSPQANIQSIGGSTQSSNVQPGTATNVLNSRNGISLRQTDLPSVNLGNLRLATTPAPSQPARPHHHSPVLIGLAILLFVIAIFMFWSTSRSAKRLQT